MAKQRYGPSFLVGVGATMRGNLAHVPAGTCPLFSPVGTGAKAVVPRHWCTRALVFGSCPSRLVAPVKPDFDLKFCKHLMDPAVVPKRTEYESSVISCDFN